MKEVLMDRPILIPSDPREALDRSICDCLLGNVTQGECYSIREGILNRKQVETDEKFRERLRVYSYMLDEKISVYEFINTMDRLEPRASKAA